MKFLADVNIPVSLIRFLESRGHFCLDARVEYPKAKDIQIIQIAKEANLIVLTRDKDFLELAKYPKYKNPLIVIRINNQKTDNIMRHIEALLTYQSEEVISRSVTIVHEDTADSYALE